ncbi:MAG: type II secretion system protein [Bacilli bacterium]|nr:type II secretion system protein [Bacilli bacterium]
MKKGFTLIEMLGVIVILSILSLITVPVIEGSLRQGREKLSDIQKGQLIKALKNYYAEDIEKLSEISTDENEPSCVDSDFLKESGYLPTDLKDPKTGKDLSVDVCCWKDNKKIKYFVKES